ncbi:WYL domain-containing protein [Algiphilus sp. W345]|uniref:WYL domain-containing protein n=1 Tax=Banduia mediterranea TaxID=3075609 RepID=A0ABU2WNC8_9GAMM|nr:WYL domain-containing protein [Algiphilus sp. W345]MDT0499045.1 WYL domain-containing protein [Algiphilus sp. W345]
MPNPIPMDLNQAQRERLSHIDFKTCFLGAIGRSDLVVRFGIKEAAATRDITLYKDLAPENLEYDTKAKIYIRAPSFEPLFDYSPSQALAALAHGFGDDFVGKHKALIACETPAQLNNPDLETLSVLTRAIHQHKAVSLVYRSLSSGRSTREVVPFVLVDNGLRWHIRGYDRKRSRFSDFVITRISAPEILDEPLKEHENREHDIQWNRIVELEIIPHPKLKHPKTIETDYAMENGVLKVNVRAAVAGYVLRCWNVDCSEKHSMDGPEYHLWLKNRQALYGVDNLVIAPGYSQSNQITKEGA